MGKLRRKLNEARLDLFTKIHLFIISFGDVRFLKHRSIDAAKDLPNKYKSISVTNRIFLVLIISFLIVLSRPYIENFTFKSDKQDDSIKIITLYVSPEIEKLFGESISEKLLQDFNDLNPYLQIAVLYDNENDDTDNNGNEIENIKNPDIFIFSEGEYNALLDSNALMEFDGQEAITLVSFMDLLFYNINLLTAAGYDRPPKTREEFLAYSRTVSEGNNASLANASGFAIALNPRDGKAAAREIFSWIWASGGDFWAFENAPVINNRSIIRDINFLGNLAREGAAKFHLTGEQALEEFALGRVAMIIASTSTIPYLRERMGDDAFSITTIPDSGFGGKYNIGISSIYAGINADCEYPEEALSFLNFLSEQSQFLYTELRAVPGDVTNLFLSEYLRNDPFYSKAYDIFIFSQIVEGFSGKRDGSLYENIVREEFRTFFQNGRTAEQTAAAIQERWDLITKEFDTVQWEIVNY